jgi:hypothetical protein
MSLSDKAYSLTQIYQRLLPNWRLKLASCGELLSSAGSVRQSPRRKMGMQIEPRGCGNGDNDDVEALASQ